MTSNRVITNAINRFCENSALTNTTLAPVEMKLMKLPIRVIRMFLKFCTSIESDLKILNGNKAEDGMRQGEL